MRVNEGTLKFILPDNYLVYGALFPFLKLFSYHFSFLNYIAKVSGKEVTVVDIIGAIETLCKD